MHLPLMQCDIKVLKRMTILKDLSQHCLVQSVIELAYLNKYFPTNIVHLACFLYLSASVLSIRQPLTVPTSECIRRLVCSTTIPRMTDDGERRKDTEWRGSERREVDRRKTGCDIKGTMCLISHVPYDQGWLSRKCIDGYHPGDQTVL